jgi:hypothetical protein
MHFDIIPHLRLGLPSVLFPSGFLTKNFFMCFYCLPCLLHALPHLIPLDLFIISLTRNKSYEINNTVFFSPYKPP